MIIRQGTASDHQRIAQLHAKSWQHNYGHSFDAHYLRHDVLEDRLQVWEERLRQPAPSQHVILLEDEDILLGFVCLFLDDSERWGTYIDNLHVDPGHYNSGYGAVLLREVAKYVLKHCPDSGLYLWVLDKNTKGIQFYLRMKGIRHEQKTFENPGGGASIAIRIAWQDPRVLIV